MRSILVVDDEEILRDTIASDLERKGYRVFRASSGHEALQLLPSHPVGLVLSDAKMPDGDGISLLRQIKAVNVDAPGFILITAFADVSEEEVFNLGAEAIFPKPFNRKALHEAVERAFLAREESWAARQSAPKEVAIQISGKAASIGRGGACVDVDSDSIVKVMDWVSFDLELLGQSGLAHLRGSGLVRWIKASPDGRPAKKMGIEFVVLADPCKDWFVNHLKQNKIRPYIPSC